LFHTALPILNKGIEMKLSNNFSASEFLNGITWEELSLSNKYLLQVLCDNVLQPVKDFLTKEYKKNIPMKVNSGMRLESDIERLRKQGYNPSVRSDHFFANAIKITNDADKKRFGDYFTYGAGAADIIPIGVDVRDVFERIRVGVKTGKLNITYGQIIYETGAGGSGWLHMSNNKKFVMSTGLADAVGFSVNGQFMQSLDGGKTYQVVSL